MNYPELFNPNDFFQDILASNDLAQTTKTEPDFSYFKLEKDLDTGWPWPLDSAQKFFEDMWNAIMNVPGRVWAVFEDKLKEALQWLWGNIAYPLATYVSDVWLITDEWTRDWGEPWKSIARLLLFPSAFLYKAWRDYIEPALSNAVSEVKKYFDGAVGGIFDAIRNAFSPIFDPLTKFADSVYDFLTKTLPDWLGKAAEFFTRLPARLQDFVSWVRDEFSRGWSDIVSFFKDKLAGFVEGINAFISDARSWLADYFNSMKQTLEVLFNILDKVNLLLSPGMALARLSEVINIIKTLDEQIVIPAVRDIAERIVESFKNAIEAAASWIMQTYELLINDVERGDLGSFISKLLPVALNLTTIALALDVASVKVAGTGIDLQNVSETFRHIVSSFFDVKTFTSVFMAIAVQKPLEHAFKRLFRTERPSPSDALKFLAKNIIDENETLSYLQIAGYPDEIAEKYIRSIYKEPPFEAVFTAYKRGKIDEREYRTWLTILNIDKAETLSGTLYPYRVLEEAAYRVPSPSIIAYAVETGEVPDDVLRRIFEYELMHPDIIDVMTSALKWRAAKDERSLLRRYVIDNFIDGALKTTELDHYLGVLGLTGDLTKSIIEAADLSRRKNIRRKALSYLEKQFLEGYMSREEFIEKLVSYGFDEDLVKEYATLLEYVRDNYIVVKETKDERNSLKSTLVNKYKHGLITDEELEQELRKLNLNEIEIALTIARAKLEFDAEQKTLLFNDLIERLKQGRLSKSEFVDQCTRLAINYDRCLAYAEYYWTKYIGDEFLVMTKDERSALASSLVKKYVMGFMTEDELRQELKKLMYTDEEIELRIKRATVEDEVKMLTDLLAEADSLLKKGELDPDEYIDYLVSLGMRRGRAEARAQKILASIRRKT